MERATFVWDREGVIVAERCRSRHSPAGSRSGLHAKAMVVDRRYVVVGSYTLDPRSADINTELALLIDSPSFAQKVAEFGPPADSFDAVRWRAVHRSVLEAFWLACHDTAVL